MNSRLFKILLPTFLLSFSICFLPFYGGGTDPASLFIVHTLLFIVLGFFWCGFFRRSELTFAVPFVALLFLPFLFYLLLRSCFSPYPFASLLTFWEVLVFFILFLIAYNLAKNQQFLKWLLLAFIFSFFIQGILIQLFSLENGYQGRTAAYFVNPNHLAAYLSMGFFLLAPFLLMKLDSPRRGLLFKGAAGAVLILLLVSLALERSRGTAISFPVVFILFLFMMRKRMTSKQFFSIILIVLLIGSLGAFLVHERFEGGKDIYQYERIRIWRASFSLFSDHFLLGSGPGLFEYRAGDYQFPQLQSLIRYGKRFSTPHSDPLLLMTEMGLVGLLLFSAPFFYGAALLFKKDGHDLQEDIRFSGWRFPLKESVSCAILVLLMQGLFDNLSEKPAIYMSAAILLGMLFSRVSGKGEQNVRLKGARKSWLLIMVSFLAWITLYHYAVLSPYIADRAMREAQRLKSQGEMEHALQKCSRALFFNKIHPDFYHFRGKHYLHHVENEKFRSDIVLRAERDLARASRLNALKALYPWDRARLYRELFYQGISLKESFERARSLYHAAEKLATLDPFIPYECAAMHFAAGQYDHALEEIKKSLDREPYFLQAQLLSVEIYRVTEDDQRAKKLMNDLKKKFTDLERYRIQNDYELKVLDYDRDAYLRICQDLGLEP